MAWALPTPPEPSQVATDAWAGGRAAAWCPPAAPHPPGEVGGEAGHSHAAVGAWPLAGDIGRAAGDVGRGPGDGGRGRSTWGTGRGPGNAGGWEDGREGGGLSDDDGLQGSCAPKESA
mmetsp:Transcript_61011/g.191854  ORF Transcript_61011/g.191854 Transcript_61011/m.191854 type:complete len:118 (-) Transcript_61011:271-624(-)